MNITDIKIRRAVYERLTARALGRHSPALAHVIDRANRWAEMVDDWLNHPHAHCDEETLTREDRQIRRQIYLRLVRTANLSTPFTAELADQAIFDASIAENKDSLAMLARTLGCSPGEALHIHTKAA